ncbi:DNA primase DnaG [Methanogenium organophilum]|uniref:DNA primase DnaG n=1 Tax=Methanogenium organophilum TaxID=2199 RepID=A0A9X9T7Y6_METOG|nr:DNA primase DnaG [Methanogenium organophilum]WAI00896.1 DNA primase DnaG [Methanogenium organophilum]
MHSQDTTKYLIHLKIEAEGVVRKSDVVGAIFGQTEGLLGEELDLRELQRTGRMGRIDVQIESVKGETRGDVHMASSLDKAETAIIAASLETIDRVGPCIARVTVDRIEDIRVSKRQQIIDRARELLIESFDEGTIDTNVIMDSVRESSRIEKIIEVGEEKLPAGPNALDSEAIIVVEGRADVINLLRYGIKNAIAVEGTNIPETIVNLCNRKTATAFVDGDRGGDLILSELVQVAEIDFVAISPRGRSVEDMSRKEIIKPLRNKIPVEYIINKEGEVDIPELHHRMEMIDSSTRERARRHQEEVRIQKQPGSLEWHMAEVKEKHTARILSKKRDILGESDADLVDDLLSHIPPESHGLIIDRMVDQKVVDYAFDADLAYVAAPDFSGIVKKPVSLKLIKIS